MSHNSDRESDEVLADLASLSDIAVAGSVLPVFDGDFYQIATRTLYICRPGSVELIFYKIEDLSFFIEIESFLVFVISDGESYIRESKAGREGHIELEDVLQKARNVNR